MHAVIPQAARIPERRHIAVEGAVQGVGFRPFVYRLACELGLTGWVQNTGEGVLVEIQGGATDLERFVDRLRAEKPSLACIVRLAVDSINPQRVPAGDFRILPSGQGVRRVAVLPDVATCPECVRELFDPANRRYRYPFTSCTHCGPRFSILESLPFDRANTTMKCFAACDLCGAEYMNPSDRRFHAQLNACPACGPQIALWNRAGRVLAEREAALREAVRHLDEGHIVAVKGLGGFHLMADAGWEQAVVRLRRRKRRESKPLALMFPNLEQIEAVCVVDETERDLLLSPEAPIVLLERHGSRRGMVRIAEAVAPDCPNLGVMLPYTPLHHLLLAEFSRPLIATSGNLSEDPICTDEGDALDRLGDVADVFLVHDRPIARHADDSVARVVIGRELLLRRARGYTPMPIRISAPPASLLAVGGHLKSTVALTLGQDLLLSQHIGDLDSPQAFDTFQRVVADFQQLFQQQPARLVRDLHPDYRSSRFAETVAPGCVSVQHHVAHVLSCLADNELDVPCLGVAWDGTGAGSDGSIWGGEWFRVRDGGVRRVASLRPFRLPGGERAVEEPRRSALGLLYAVYGAPALAWSDLPPVQSFSESERRVVATMLERGLNAPLTSSAGRLFDGIAALIGLHQVRGFEGQAAMALEYAALESCTTTRYPIAVMAEPQAPDREGRARPPLLRADWAPLLERLLVDVRAGCAPGEIAARFHHALVDFIVEIARRVGEEHVVLTGGCFQNRYLLEHTVARLRHFGFKPIWHRRIPPNDGGLAAGQALAVARGLVDLD